MVCSLFNIYPNEYYINNCPIYTIYCNDIIGCSNLFILTNIQQFETNTFSYKYDSFFKHVQ